MTVQLTVLGEVLAAEHAAVFGYGALIAVLSGAERQAALAGLDTHRARRDRLRRMTLDAGGTPVESQAAYELPRPLSAAAATELAAGIERDIALAYGALVTASDGDDRGFAARTVQDAAVREAAWRGAVPRFPGLEDPGFAPATPTPTPAPAAD